MKNKIGLFNTNYAKENGVVRGVESTMRYLIDNRRTVITDNDATVLYQTKMLSMSPLNKIFLHLYTEGMMDAFTLIDTSMSTQSIPELLSINDFTVDTKQFDNAKNVFGTIPEFKNKIIINVAPLVRRSRDGFVRLISVDDLHNQVVRGALVSSYYNCTDDTWLNPALVKYIANTYSACIANPIVNHYRLSIPEQLTIMGIFTYFIMNKMSDAAYELTSQCEYLGNKFAIKTMLDRFDEVVDDKTEFDIDKACDLVVACGPDHMKNFNRDILIRMVGRIGSSPIATNVALEYPPYWTHQLVYALSGTKTRLNDILQKTKLLKSAQEFLINLDTSRQFVPSVAVKSGKEDLQTVSLFDGYIGTVGERFVKDSFKNMESKYADNNDIEPATEGIGLVIVGTLIALLGIGAIQNKIDSKKHKELVSKLNTIAMHLEPSIKTCYTQYTSAYSKCSAGCRQVTTIHPLITVKASGKMLSAEEFTKVFLSTIADKILFHKNRKVDAAGLPLKLDLGANIYVDIETLFENEDEYKDTKSGTVVNPHNFYDKLTDAIEKYVSKFGSNNAHCSVDIDGDDGVMTPVVIISTGISEQELAALKEQLENTKKDAVSGSTEGLNTDFFKQPL